MKRKPFNAIKFMRDRRDELSTKYLKHPETQEGDLAQIRKKYNKFKSTAAKKRLKAVHSTV